MAREKKQAGGARSGAPRDAADGTERAATEVEREGMDLLGRSSVRDGALDGVSDRPARSDQRADGGPAAGGTGPRRNPPELPSVDGD